MHKIMHHKKQFTICVKFSFVTGHPLPLAETYILIICFCGDPENYQETALKQEYNFNNGYKLCNIDGKQVQNGNDQ